MTPRKRSGYPYQLGKRRLFRCSFVKPAHKTVDSHTTVRDFGACAMNENNDRRREQRLRYYWPIWFAEDFNRSLSQGQMVDICSKAAAFTCYSHEGCPYLGQYITSRFSVPHYGPDDSFDMANFTRSGHVFRVDNVNSFLRRVAVQFAEPLPFRPGEQNTLESEAGQVLQPAMA